MIMTFLVDRRLLVYLNLDGEAEPRFVMIKCSGKITLNSR